MKGEDKMGSTEFWVNLFGTANGWFGINIGFWVGMGFTALAVVVENLVFWLMPPHKDGDGDKS